MPAPNQSSASSSETLSGWNLLLEEIRHNPLLWLLAFLPVVFAAHKIRARVADTNAKVALRLSEIDLLWRKPLSFHRRGDCHQHVVHVGRVVLAFPTNTRARRRHER